MSESIPVHTCGHVPDEKAYRCAHDPVLALCESCADSHFDGHRPKCMRCRMHPVPRYQGPPMHDETVEGKVVPVFVLCARFCVECEL